MYAYQLFEELKAEVQQIYNEDGNKALAIASDKLYKGMRELGFTASDAVDAIFGAFACVACNDGRLVYNEFRAFSSVMANDEKVTYDAFFKLMSKYNRQEHRNRTIELFNSINSKSVAGTFICLCIATCLVDGNVADREETFCTSLCEIYIKRFGL